MVSTPEVWRLRHGDSARAGTLLVVDDDPINCRLMRAIFEKEGWRVVAVGDGQAGIDGAAAERPDLVLLDLQLPGADGIEILKVLKSAHPSVPIVMLTASHDPRTVVRAMKAGAADYATKPVDDEELLVVVRRAVETRQLRREVEELRRRVGRDRANTLDAQMGPSAHVSALVQQVAIVAESEFTVLILGETGTGKELVAQAIHQASARRGKPFVALDCGAIPEPLLESELFGHERGAFTGADRRKHGRLRLAEGGTCLLDELGNLPTALQAKLLRVLESRQLHPVGAEEARPMDVRFIGATNDDLQLRVAQGAFRADLYFRVAQYTITLPPLRQRPEDIPFLSQRFLEEACVELRRPVETIVPDALELLTGYSWPGNVRELRNVIRQAVLTTRDLAIRVETVRALLGTPASARPPADAPPAQSLKAVADHAARTAERQTIRDTLRRTNGNKSEAARALRTDYKTLHVKMKALGIRAADFIP
jgi:two-component system nitrogen regulation response regulator GlnG